MTHVSDIIYSRSTTIPQNLSGNHSDKGNLYEEWRNKVYLCSCKTISNHNRCFINLFTSIILDNLGLNPAHIYSRFFSNAHFNIFAFQRKGNGICGMKSNCHGNFVFLPRFSFFEWILSDLSIVMPKMYWQIVNTFGIFFGWSYVPSVFLD